MSKFKILVVLLVTLAIPSWAESTEQPNAGAHTEFEAGIAALDEGAHKHAIQHFSTAIQSGELSGKELSRAFSNRATASAQLRRYEGATQALILNPVNATAWLGRASAYLETDQFRNAYNDIEELFEFEKDIAEAWYIMGRAGLAFRNVEYIQGHFMAAVRLDPNNADYWYGLGLSHQGMIEINEAMEAFTRAIILDPGHLEAERELASVERFIDNPDDGKREFRRNLMDREYDEIIGENFAGVQWQGADLSGRILNGAKLNGANLAEADLSDAKLEAADLSAANLKGANLTNARLYRANFTGAICRVRFLPMQAHPPRISMGRTSNKQILSVCTAIIWNL